MNFNICLKTRVSIMNALIRSRLTYGCQVWTLSAEQWRRISSFYCGLLRRMVRGGFKRRENSMALRISNESLIEMSGTESLKKFIYRQQRQYFAHIVRREDDSLLKMITFNDDEIHVPGPYNTLRSSVLKRETINESEFYRRAKKSLI